MVGWSDIVGELNGACIDAFKEPTPTNYQPAEGDQVDVDGIFDDNYLRLDAGEAGVSSTGPRVFYRLADLPTNPMTEDKDALRIVIRGANYRVVEPMPDGQGGIWLRLHQVDDE